MPKSAKSALREAPEQEQLPFDVGISGNPFDVESPVPATLPLPNDVIITNVSGPYTEKDRKLWAFLVAAVWDDLLTEDVHNIKAAQINAVFREKGGDTSSKWIWESAERLMDTKARWEDGLDGQRLKKSAGNLLAYASMEKDMPRNATLQFQIPKKLCEVIKKPYRFSRLRLHFMIGLSGKYAVTLYMLLETAANLQNPVLEVKLEALRNWLKIPEGKFEKWFDIKRFILEPAIKQINESPETAGFSVTVEPIKQGRSVEVIRFTITKSQERLAEEKRLKTKSIENKTTEGNTSVHLPTSAYEQAKRQAPLLDIYALEVEWKESIKSLPPILNPAGHFVEFCKKKAGKK